MRFIEKWLQAVDTKNSLLCVNIDPAEWGQRPTETMEEGADKIKWTKTIIQEVAPFAAAIKTNRQYFKDLSRKETQDINQLIHELGMVSIDDSKIADIGDTNDAALYHAAAEGFDAVTYAPFPGNIAATCKMAQERQIGLIPLVLMSNPEFELIKSAQIKGEPYFQFIAGQVRKYDADGVVIGAPSALNHLTVDEVTSVKEIIGSRCVLVPGIGAQGGDLEPLVKVFGDYTIVSVGRGISYQQSPREASKEYYNLIQACR